MQAPIFSALLAESAIDLAWSVWAEMGVSGWMRRHGEWRVDPEPLIVFTASLGDADSRLRDEATDWCVRYARYVSAARLKNVLACFAENGDAVRVAFGEFAATVNAHTNESRWPGATLPRQYGPTERSHLEDFTAPSLVALRLRALFGVGARAEVVRILLEHPAQDLAVSDFDAAFYTRRNVAEALEALRMGGLVEPLAGRGVRRYRLRRTSQLHAFVGSLAQFKPDWVAIFLLLQNLRSLASRTESLLLVVRAVEARKFVRERLVLLQRIGLEAPPAVTGESYWHSFENWAIEMARAFAAGETPAASIKPQLAGRCASL